MTPSTAVVQLPPSTQLGSDNPTGKAPTLMPSACRCCQFYKPQGRSGGYCQRLEVPVYSYWRSCPLALPPFAPSWERGREPMYQCQEQYEETTMS